jgi:homoserine kinase
LFVSALAQGRHELVFEAMQDRLHQPARSGLLPWLPALLEGARRGGALGASLSGAGTTVFALCTGESVRDVARAMTEAAAQQKIPGRSEIVEVGVPGARVVA